MISARDARRARTAGFTKAEIGEMGESKELVNLDSPAWQSALQLRRDFKKSLEAKYLKAGARISPATYDYLVNKTRKKNSPWDWLKLIYLPKQKVDFQGAIKKHKAKSLATRRLLRQR